MSGSGFSPPGAGSLGRAALETSKENLQGRLSLPLQEEGRVHNAVYDARYQALILAALLNLPKRSDQKS